MHGVWKSLKKSHSTLQAKLADFTVWVYACEKMAKMFHMESFWKLKQSKNVTRQVKFNSTEINWKCQNGRNGQSDDFLKN